MKLIRFLLFLALCTMTAFSQDLVRPTFIGNTTHSIGGVTAEQVLTETDQAANSRRWSWKLNAGSLIGQITNDNGTSPVPFMTVTRSGNTITAVSFPRIDLSQIVSGANTYHNWGSTLGSSGYGLRDNSGTLEYKNNGGVWQALANPAPQGGGWVDSGSTIQPLTGTDTVQVGNLNTTRFAATFSGANAGAQLVSAISDLPSTGGVIYTGLEGSQTITADPFSGVTKNIDVYLGAGTYTSSVDITVPSNVTLHFSKGSLISMNVGTTMKIYGTVKAPQSRIFTGAGTVLIPSTTTGQVPPQWWGAKADGVRYALCSITSGTAALTCADGSFTSADNGKMIVVIGAGASDKTLATTISNVTGATTATLTANASTTVANANARLASDDTTALQAWINATRSQIGTSYDRAYHSACAPAGYYGFTTLRLWSYQEFCGDTFRTEFWRLGQGSGGPALGMTSGEHASQMKIHDFTIECNMVGSGLDCVDFGTETPGTTDFALGSYIRDVFIRGGSGINLDLQVNVAFLENVWITNGYTEANYPNTAKGLVLTGSQVSLMSLSVEGFYPSSFLTLNTADSVYNKLQLELDGGTPKDIITVAGSGNTFINPYTLISTDQLAWFKISAGSNNIKILDGHLNPVSGATVTKVIDDDVRGRDQDSPNYTVSFWDGASTSLVALNSPNGSIDVKKDNTIGAIQTFATFSTTDSTNQAINLQTVTTGNRGTAITLGGAMGSTATAGSPKLTSGSGDAYSLWAQVNKLSLLCAATGTNVTPVSCVDYFNNGDQILSDGKFVFFHGGVSQWTEYGAGTATFAADGTISSASDERLKDVKGNFSSGLEAIKKIQPITYSWNEQSRIDQKFPVKPVYAGFSAQNVAEAIPDAVGQSADGYLTLQDRALMAAMVNAIKELEAKVAALEAKQNANQPQ